MVGYTVLNSDNLSFVTLTGDAEWEPRHVSISRRVNSTQCDEGLFRTSSGINHILDVVYAKCSMNLFA